ncbi:MAG: CopG family transcriptional regulator [Nitrosomonas sp.]
MSHRTTIILDDESFAFLNNIARENRSAYINGLLRQEHKHHLKQALLKANLEEATDSEYQQELEEWNTVLSDGLSND